MWKSSLTAILILSFFILWFVMSPKSSSYWQNIGPSWDKMLNPEKYRTEKMNG